MGSVINMHSYVIVMSPSCTRLRTFFWKDCVFLELDLISSGVISESFAGVQSYISDSLSSSLLLSRQIILFFSGIIQQAFVYFVPMRWCIPWGAGFSSMFSKDPHSPGLYSPNRNSQNHSDCSTVRHIQSAPASLVQYR